MELRTMIVTLDRMGMNSRSLSGRLERNEELREEYEAGRLAQEILSAFQRAGANTAGEALALLRTYPMILQRDRTLEWQAAEHRRTLERHAEKEQLVQSLLKAAVCAANMPCEAAPVAAASAGYAGGFSKTEEIRRTTTIRQDRRQEE